MCVLLGLDDPVSSWQQQPVLDLGRPLEIAAALSALQLGGE